MKIAFELNARTLLAAAALGLAGALAVGGSGLVSIAASSGHFGPVSWFLHWTMGNAVGTQSLGIAVPPDVDLADPALVRRAAGHYASGCAACHGAPGAEQSPVVRAMMPPPPRLEDRIAQWKDRELFWIVRHGVKYSGMPAWVGQGRPDEVWAMVAFLRAYPGLTPKRYADLALGAGAPVGLGGVAQKGVADAFETALADCARCHGRDGRGRNGEGLGDGAFPSIAGQSEAYLAEALGAYAGGARQSGIMQPAVGVHDTVLLKRLAAHYAGQSPAPGPAAETPATAPGLPETPTQPTGAEPPPTGDTAATRRAVAAAVEPAAPHGPPHDRAALVALGRAVATEGLPTRKLPACESCHGGDGRARNPSYPRLAGQPAWYLSTQLHLWKRHERGGGPYAHLMDKIAPHLTDEQIEALSLWYSEKPTGG